MVRVSAVQSKSHVVEALRFCNTPVYYALVEEVDTWVGRLVDRLEKLGVADNTLVIFTSDHGETLGAHGMVRAPKAS